MPNPYRRSVDIPQSSRIAYIAEKILIPLIVGIVGVGGALGGAYTTGWLNVRQFEKQKAVEWESQIFTQRMGIIDRSATIFGKSPGIQDFWRKYVSSLPETVDLVKFDPSVEVVTKLTEYHGEFESVMNLAALYFGPKTRDAIRSIGTEPGPWWNKSKEGRDAFIQAMVEELTVNFRHFPEVLRSAR